MNITLAYCCKRVKIDFLRCAFESLIELIKSSLPTRRTNNVQMKEEENKIKKMQFNKHKQI